jgi:hypothetical protein
MQADGLEGSWCIACTDLTRTVCNNERRKKSELDYEAIEGGNEDACWNGIKLARKSVEDRDGRGDVRRSHLRHRHTGNLVIGFVHEVTRDKVATVLRALTYSLQCQFRLADKNATTFPLSHSSLLTHPISPTSQNVS